MEPKLHLDAIYVPSEDVVATEIEGRFVLASACREVVDLECDLFGLNEVGKAIWEGLDGRRNLRDVVTELCREFDAPPDEIEVDAIDFVGELLGKRMLVKISGTDCMNEEHRLSLVGPAVVELLRTILSKGKSFKLRTKDFHMSPFIKDGDAVTVSPLAESSPRVGDVVAFVQAGTEQVRILRVVRKRGDSYVMKGDCARETAGFLPRDNVLGRVTQVQRDNRRVKFGLGPERVLIAFLSCRGLFQLAGSACGHSSRYDKGE